MAACCLPILTFADHGELVFDPEWDDNDHDRVNDVAFGISPIGPLDNCNGVFNPWQYDTDGDGIGSACDPDDDGPVAVDTNFDGDAFPDSVDLTPGFPCISSLTGNDSGICEWGQYVEPSGDDDFDGIRNDRDNAPTFKNPDQSLDLVNYWDWRQPGRNDRDMDWVINAEDICPDDWNPPQPGSALQPDVCNGDFNRNGIPDSTDSDPWNMNTHLTPEFVELRRQLRESEANQDNLLDENEQLSESLLTALDDLETCKGRARTCQTNLSDREEQNERLQQRINVKNQEINTLEDTVSAKQTVIGNLRGRISRMRDRILTLVRRIRDLL